MNDMGGWTRASPDLYPHQWSWDSAFIAIGLAHLDIRRAAREIEGLFAHQWKTGKVPHIVFDDHAPPESYFPGPEHWSSACNFPDSAPDPSSTSALCQPPVHAIAVRHIWRVAERRGSDMEEVDGFLKRIYPALLSWHRYLLTCRDPEESGLVTIYHPWESGTDNSPRWDRPMERLEVGEMPGFVRQDLQHVEDPSERPTDFQYERYLWLVELIKRTRCDEDAIYDTHPFLVKDVLASAILVAANEALLEIAVRVGAEEGEREVLETWISRGRRGLEGCWDPDWGLYLDYDLRAGELLPTRTVAGFAPVVSGKLDPGRLEALVARLQSSEFAGHPRLCRSLPPSTSPEDLGFERRSYWRGPVWPVMNWLLWWALGRAGQTKAAGRLRLEGLEQLDERGFGEYFEPFVDEPLGSLYQSWTAAVALDWLYADPLAVHEPDRQG